MFVLRILHEKIVCHVYTLLILEEQTYQDKQMYFLTEITLVAYFIIKLQCLLQAYVRLVCSMKLGIVYAISIQQDLQVPIIV